MKYANIQELIANQLVLAEELGLLLIKHPKSVAALSRDIGVCQLSLSKFLLGDGKLQPSSIFKIVNYLQRIELDNNKN